MSDDIRIDALQGLKKLGLQPYLGGTHDLHNGYSYRDFDTMVTNGVNATNLSRVFGVNVKTVNKWLDVYEYEKNKKGVGHEETTKGGSQITN